MEQSLHNHQKKKVGWWSEVLFDFDIKNSDIKAVLSDCLRYAVINPDIEVVCLQSVFNDDYFWLWTDTYANKRLNQSRFKSYGKFIYTLIY